MHPALRLTLLVLGRYILIGFALNWSTVFATWGVLAAVTWGDMDTWREIDGRYSAKRVRVPMAGPLPLRVFQELLIWPVNVLNNLCFGAPAALEALRRRRGKGHRTPTIKGGRKP